MRIFFFLILSFITTTAFGQQERSIDPKQLLGRWISMDDDKYELVFDSASQREYYDNELQAVHSYRLKGHLLVLTDKQTRSVYSYSVVELTASRLILLYQDRGNLLRFNKSPRRYRKVQKETAEN